MGSKFVEGKKKIYNFKPIEKYAGKPNLFVAFLINNSGLFNKKNDNFYETINIKDDSIFKKNIKVTLPDKIIIEKNRNY